MLQRTLLLLLLFASSLFAQAKVGTIGARFLEISPSVRANGMGENGVALVDRQSWFHNPGTLGLVGNNLATASLYLGLADFPAEVDYHSAGVTMRVAGGGNGQLVNVAIQRIWLESGNMIERTYEQGTYEGTGRVFTAESQAYSATVATGFGSRIKIGLGGTARWIEEDLSDYSATGLGFDVGTIVRVPLTGWGDSQTLSETRSGLNLTFGASLSNFGRGIEFIAKRYPLPKTVRLGTAIEAAYYGLTANAVIENQSSLETEGADEKFGLEIGFRSALWARVGHVDGDINDNGRTTFGGSVSVRGVVNLVTGRPTGDIKDGGFLRRLDLIGSYAVYSAEESSLWDGIDFFMLELVI